MKSLFAGSALLLTLGLTTPGCREARSSTEVPEGTPEIVLRGEDALRVRFGGDIQRLLLAGRYDSLEAMAESLRNRDVRWPNGGWKLRTFYNQGFDIALRNATEADWQAHLGKLRQWRGAYPGSITAPVAYAYALRSYAWEARGSAVANEVTEEGWRKMRERLSEARSVLVDARKLPRVCPGWWMTAQGIALGEDWDRKVYEELFQEAVRTEPSFENYYERKAIYLLPRWNGRAGEWEAFADTVANRLPAPLGDQMYARIVWYTHEYMGDDNVFEESQISWDRTRRGFEELIKAYPASLELRSIFAYLAWKAADQPTAKQQFIELGPRIDPGVWEDRPEFMEARKWAFE
jgi:Domain of unknown function (DUF4034)